MFLETRRWQREQEADALMEQAMRVSLTPAVSEAHADELGALAASLREQAAALREPWAAEFASPDDVPDWVMAAMEAEPA